MVKIQEEGDVLVTSLFIVQNVIVIDGMVTNKLNIINDEY